MNEVFGISILVFLALLIFDIVVNVVLEHKRAKNKELADAMERLNRNQNL